MKTNAKGHLELFGDWCNENGYDLHCCYYRDPDYTTISELIEVFKDELRRGIWPKG